MLLNVNQYSALVTNLRTDDVIEFKITRAFSVCPEVFLKADGDEVKSLSKCVYMCVYVCVCMCVCGRGGSFSRV